ncbi:transglutaminase family protein [Pseudomaricurvus alkylphenolicus]|uniref:transglutaminase-like domain-containing protein n=1 Tax=Pseudomaricurvus alkylphenolicus TaxID=1306991 RepID=UPI00142164DC|nr:transglutaminase family protein [Pseudomaricurvus alkylphenolicus]NIB38725.1 transglutaminase family protein [Pseudomaricurvus alkylphenolicus]
MGIQTAIPVSGEPTAASLTTTSTIDCCHPAIAVYAEDKVRNLETDLERAVKLYYCVRDEIRYDPYSFDFALESFAASSTLSAGMGWCVPKAILLAACCRSQGIPARLGFADVKNHLSTERLRETMKTDVFHWHGYTSIHLNGKWVKATPAFNIELCDKFGLKPLEFNGLEDSIYHEFDRAGNRHMEYILERGEYDDLPLQEMLHLFREVYGGFFDHSNLGSHSFDDDVERETAR